MLIAGCGYVGTELGRCLVAEGHRVVGVRRPGADPTPLLAAGIVPLFADLADPGSAPALLGRWDWVVQCAAPRERGVEPYRRAYLLPALHLLEWLAPNPPEAWVLVGSTGVHGQTDGLDVDEGTPPEPATATGRILLDTERVYERAAASGWSAIRLRVAGIYGPMRNRLNAIRSGTAELTGEGDRYMNMVHRDDLVQAIRLTLQRGRPGEVYHVTDGSPVREREFHEWLGRRLVVPMPPSVPVPGSGPEASESRPARRRTNKRVVARRVRDELGWTPRYPSFREGYESLFAAEWPEAGLSPWSEPRPD